jgi:hypothetical protein
VIHHHERRLQPVVHESKCQPARRISPLTTTALPEFNRAIAHLRDVLGDQTYESLARKCETMTTAAMVTYACDQIDQARTELNAVAK